MVTEAQSKPREIYAVPLSTVQAKTESIKKLSQEKAKAMDWTSRGLMCKGTSPVRRTIYASKRLQPLVMQLIQTAALKCGDSPEKAVMAKHIWDQSRNILRQPSRWESRRTLYFFEP